MKSNLKSLYDIVPFKKNVFTVLKKLFNTPGKYYKHLYFKGKFKVPLNKEKHFYLFHHGFQLENEVFWSGIRGRYEGMSLEIWIKLAEQSNTIFDVGANTGIYAVSAKGINPKAKVHAFEPIKRVCEKLKLNNEINNFDIICVEKALSKDSGVAEIFDVPNTHEYIVSLERDRLEGVEGAEKVTIQMIDFASYVEEVGLQHVDLMKIDVEYHEYEVLLGMKDYLKKFMPDMLIEIVEESIAEQVHELIKDLGYQYYNIDDINGTISRVDRVSKSYTYNILVCKPSTAIAIGIENEK